MNATMQPFYTSPDNIEVQGRVSPRSASPGRGRWPSPLSSAGGRSSVNGALGPCCRLQVSGWRPRAAGGAREAAEQQLQRPLQLAALHGEVVRSTSRSALGALTESACAWRMSLPSAHWLWTPVASPMAGCGRAARPARRRTRPQLPGDHREDAVSRCPHPASGAATAARPACALGIDEVGTCRPRARRGERRATGRPARIARACLLRERPEVGADQLRHRQRRCAQRHPQRGALEDQRATSLPLSLAEEAQRAELTHVGAGNRAQRVVAQSGRAPGGRRDPAPAPAAPGGSSPASRPKSTSCRH
jgi:hypothetical protein